MGVPNYTCSYYFDEMHEHFQNDGTPWSKQIFRKILSVNGYSARTHLYLSVTIWFITTVAAVDVHVKNYAPNSLWRVAFYPLR